MKNILSYAKTAVILLLVTLISLGFYVYMIARPISYGMGYTVKTAYDNVAFEGSITFEPDSTMSISNSTFEIEMKYRHYYKNGYLFSILSTEDEDYETEVNYINENFEEALNTPFYAGKINAFRYIPGSIDSYTTVYTCVPAVIFAAVGGIVEAALAALTCVSFALYKKSKSEE